MLEISTTFVVPSTRGSLIFLGGQHKWAAIFYHFSIVFHTFHAKMWSVVVLTVISEDVITFGAAVFCCEQHGQWRLAQKLLQAQGWCSIFFSNLQGPYSVNLTRFHENCGSWMNLEINCLRLWHSKYHAIWIQTCFCGEEMWRKNGSGKGGVHRCPCCSCFPGQEMVEIQVEKNAVTVNSAISTFGCRSSAGGGLSSFFLAWMGGLYPLATIDFPHFSKNLSSKSFKHTVLTDAC